MHTLIKKAEIDPVPFGKGRTEAVKKLRQLLNTNYADKESKIKISYDNY